ncbi:uncharacterized protein METZ01_LOCUS478028, partial [marine metagenome]
ENMVINDDGILYLRSRSTECTLAAYNLKRLTDSQITTSLTNTIGASYALSNYLAKLSLSTLQDALDDSYYWLVVQTTDNSTLNSVEDIPFQFQIDMKSTPFTSLSTTSFHSSLSSYSLRLISGDVTIVNMNKTGNSSGDPIISPICSLPYQLPCDDRCYLLFDNQDSQRLIINSKMRLVQDQANNSQSLRKWGIYSENLSYIKYISIFWENKWTIYDIDKLALIDDNMKIKSFLQRSPITVKE